jgi:hypothetical protein
VDVVVIVDVVVDGRLCARRLGLLTIKSGKVSTVFASATKPLEQIIFDKPFRTRRENTFAGGWHEACMKIDQIGLTHLD